MFNGGNRRGIDATDLEKINIVLSTMYLCIDFAMWYIGTRGGSAFAADCKEEMLKSLKSGDINMALMEDAATFDYVVAKIEALHRL
ncbi:hypothetical protein [Bosea rubneri]|uniref:Uncharacterized protein n=1 Tax=Bosea rubneri TaxID=3075434 RepID=A0ABU3SB77_9HYPH|nr:hypothetical protein [Bosea sp. ZW T0_25]MDU0342054.1 hypothetical protein [Bosea sp. ZW T0_25]